MSKEMRQHIDNFRNFLTENSKKKLNISDVMFSESKLSTFEEKELDEILFDINKCSGEEGMKKLVKMQSMWSNMNKSNKIRSKVLKAIKNRLDDIGF
jgi:hypothetical protein